MSIYILPLFILIYIGHVFIFLVPFLPPRLNPLYFSKKNEPLWLKPSLKVSEILPICVANRSVKIAYLRIYGLCLTLAVSLFSIFVALNFGHGGFLGDNDFTMFVRQTLMGYLVLSVGVVSPLFYWLEVVLQHQRSGKSIRSCCLGLQPIQQLALFSYLLFNIMPLVEVVKSFLGVSSFQPDLMPYFMLWGAAYALVPLIAFTLIGDSRRSLALLNIRPTGMKSMLSNNFSLNNRGHYQVLNNREFSLDLLEGKSDADVITLIDIAKSSGHFEKAEQMSKYLLERQ